MLLRRPPGIAIVVPCTYVQHGRHPNKAPSPKADTTVWDISDTMLPSSLRRLQEPVPSRPPLPTKVCPTYYVRYLNQAPGAAPWVGRRGSLI